VQAGSFWCSGSSQFPETSPGDPLLAEAEGPDEAEPGPELSLLGVGERLGTVCWVEVGRGTTSAWLAESVDTKYAPVAKATGSVTPAIARIQSLSRLIEQKVARGGRATFGWALGPS
jgi:hypothetical protein